MKDYLQHLTLLDLKKDKSRKERLAKKSAEASKTYQGYNWNRMFKDGSLSKRTKAVLDKYLKHHGIPTVSNKHGKLMVVKRPIIEQHVLDSAQEEENPPSVLKKKRNTYLLMKNRLCHCRDGLEFRR